MTAPARVLVVDDEPSMQEFLEIFLRSEGFVVETAGNIEHAQMYLENDEFDLVISDIQMPGGSGLELLQAAKKTSPDTLMIMITAFASTETAIEAMKQGAYDYITKPFKVDELKIVLEKALEKKLLASENKRLRSELQVQTRDRSIIGTSPPMQRVYDLVTQVAASKANVLITGESGSGKEMVARALHSDGDRCDRPFVALNCAAIPENLLESELFGHVKGAFTGAFQNKQGLFGLADGGTLFLDEVGELSLPIQVKLLRAIQEKTFRRVGGTTDEHVDVRLLAATNRCLEDEVRAGAFREDLYYRINVIEIAVPPLRERRDDIALLVSHFMEKHADESGETPRKISKQAMDLLLEYAYPGNVRELENIIERAVALSSGPVIETDALPPALLNPASPAKSTQIPAEGISLEEAVNDYERALLSEAMRAAGGVKKRAASLVGVSFRSFRYRLEKLGLDRGDGEG